MTDARILVIDIETSPIALLGWKMFDENFSLDQIEKDWTILSYAAKWLDKPKIFYGDTGGRGKAQVRNDRRLMKPIWVLLNEADIVVAQNGIKFDVRKMNARLIQHGFGPPSPYRVVDTMREARRYFAFTSQKLAYTSKALGDTRVKDEHPEYPGFKLWTACLADDPKAWPVMKRYNIEDILATEEVYKKIRGWIANHPNLGTFMSSEEHHCPHCGSKDVEGRGNRVLLQVGVYKRYFCKKCRGWSRGSAMLNLIDKRRSLLRG